MTKIDWGRVRPLLSRLWELPEKEHGAFLARECADDPELAERVRQMFQEECEESRFLESPLQEDETAFGKVGAGARCGPYRLLGRLGEGGMGEVWLAERADDTFHKRVAVKLLKQGLHSDDVLQRFRNERQVLAWLDHPGIARLVDGGRTELGLPYLVMEYVEGAAIDHYCDEQRLSIDARLELFLSVCDAVQHAHERGVIHRDLKPSNVLVDAQGRARLLDFGIAKVLGAESGEELLDLTRTGQRLYSPHYAPPEQVRGEEVTAASDVYSLGVALFELLTGRRPYRVKSLSQFELERIVCEEEPERPSTSTGTAVRTAPEPEPWSARGFENEHGLRRRLAGDLDWILLACLRKEPERRYANAAALAGDVRRHLDGRAVEARPESAAYRASRFVRRNRALVASFVAVVVVIASALAVALALLSDAHRAEASRSLEAYAAGLQVAEGAIRANDLSQAAAALDRVPAEHRGWEWRHLDGRLDRSTGNLVVGEFQYLDRLDCDPEGRFGVVWTQLALADPRRETLRLKPLREASQSRAYSGGTPHASFHPDGELLVVATFAERAQIVDARTLDLVHELPDDRVRGVAFSPDGNRIALVRSDGEAALLAWPSLTEEARWQTGVDRPYYVRIAPDGELLAIAGWDESVRLWHAGAQGVQPVATLSGHTMEVRSLVFSPGGDRLATASLDRTVRVWQLEDPGATPFVFRQHGTSLDAVLFHPTDGTIFSRDMNGEILRWDPASGSVRNRIRSHGSGALGITPDGATLVAIEGKNRHDSLLRSWPSDSDDVATWKSCEFSNAVAFAPDGATLYCSAPDGTVRRWDRAGLELPRLEIDSVPLRMSQSLDGGHVVAYHADGRLTRWDLAGRWVNTFDLGLEPRDHTSVEAKGARAALCVRNLNGPRVAVVDLEEGHTLATADLEVDVWHAVWSRSGDELHVLGQDSVWTWSPFEEAPPRRVASLEMQAGHASLEPGGKRLLLATLSPALRLVDLETGEVTELADPGTEGRSTAWHPSEPRFAVGYADGSTGIWDAEHLRELVRLRGHQGTVRSLAFSPDGERLASCGDDGLVKVWDAPELP